MRGLAALAAGALLWGISAAPASADDVRKMQWVLDNYGATDRVWPISQGDGVVVGLIDSGVIDHQDLAGQLVPGKDFSNSGGTNIDTDGHGTVMAGDIAARGHGDNAGVMGLAPKAKVMPLKIGRVSGGGLDSNTVADAIRYAVDHGVKVINMSFVGVDGRSKELRSAVNYAMQKDVVLVAGAGNNGDEVGSALQYPGLFPGVVIASAVDKAGAIWPKSVAGEQVTLAAPGVDIVGIAPESPTAYVKSSGTSDSSAFISATAALIRSKYPNLSAGQVINRMIKTAVQPEGQGPFPNAHYGYGIVSPGKALAANPAVDSGPKENPLLKRAEPGVKSTDPSSAAPSSAGTDAAQAPPTGGSPSGSKAGSDSGSSNGMLLVVGGGVLVVLVVVVVVVLVRRSKGGSGGNGGSGGGPGGSNGPGGPGGPAYGYPQQQPPVGGYGQQPPGGYGGPQAGAGYQQPQYPPQQPPAGGNPNPYQR